MLDLNQFSGENLKKIQKILKIIIDELELQTVNRLGYFNKISLKKLEKEGLYQNDVIAVIERINENGDIVEIINERLRASLQEQKRNADLLKNTNESYEIYGIFGPTEKELNEYLFVKVVELEELRAIKENVDEKLREFNKNEDKISQNKIQSIYDFGFDQHLNRKEVVEENERAFQQRQKGERDERERRERLKIERVAKSGKPLLVYAIDKIIDECILQKDKERIEIDFHSLGFEDNMHELTNARRLFETLKNEGGFETAQPAPYNWFIVTKPNIEKLREYKKTLENTGKYASISIHKEITFDHKTFTLHHGDKKFKPQKKGGRAQIIKELWNTRRIINPNGKLKREGSFRTIDELAVAGGFAKNVLEFNQKQARAERSVRDAIQDLRDKLNKMKAPAEIIAQNGFMLVIQQ